MSGVNPKRRLILLTGFMGAGKTTLAHALARKLDCEALDLDASIVRREKRNINQIVEQEGEAKFRALEREVLRDALEEETACVIALGGGAWTMEDNRLLITGRGGYVVWLDAPFALCWRRIEAAGTKMRPLAPTRAEAQKLYDARQTFYKLAALHVKIGEESSAADLADEIIKRAAWIKTGGVD